MLSTIYESEASSSSRETKGFSILDPGYNGPDASRDASSLRFGPLIDGLDEALRLSKLVQIDCLTLVESTECIAEFKLLDSAFLFVLM